MFCSCSQQQQPAPSQWEYEVVEIKGSKLPKTYSPGEKEELIKRSNFLPLQFQDNAEVISILNHWGNEGWELVDVYTVTETIFPNFGDESMHTGIKANTRTNAINFVFKRQKSEK